MVNSRLSVVVCVVVLAGCTVRPARPTIFPDYGSSQAARWDAVECMHQADAANPAPAEAEYVSYPIPLVAVPIAAATGAIVTAATDSPEKRARELQKQSATGAWANRW